MRVSYSQLSTYLDCQRKWQLSYVDKIKTTSPHLTFGDMAHKVMENREIPDEGLYPELKEFFNITSWYSYFSKILKDLDAFFDGYSVIYKEYYFELENINGYIDLVLEKDGLIYLLDYKFTTTPRNYDTFKADQQLYIYAMAYAKLNNIPLESIRIGYINIPKSQFNKPRVLKDGSLSRDVSQRVTYDDYYDKISELGLNHDDYLDELEHFKEKRAISVIITYVSKPILIEIAKNIDLTITDMQKGYTLEKWSESCRYCEYYEVCKKNRE